ncbi:MAG: hypothetical protein NTW25_11135 [Candidatus Kapabacteria bacterium]|nr:hypothetical protein [Candidatus Kapabacteria bacterium]
MIIYEYEKEYREQKEINRSKLNSYLEDVWKNNKNLFGNSTDSNENEKQPYLKFDGEKFKANNFIGFIFFQGHTIEIYPKIFNSKDNKIKVDDAKDSKLMLDNIFYWLRYYRKFKLASLHSNLDLDKIEDFFELFLYLVSIKLHDAVCSQPYNQFEEIEEALYSPKGRIDFTKYASQRLARGTWHVLDCIYEPFIYDNTMNQVIKYTSRLIASKTTHQDTKNKLNEISFILDEVTDRVCTIRDIESIMLNPIFSEYEEVLLYCKMIIEQQIYSNESFELKQLTFLIPMEEVFEDFVAGILKEEDGFKDLKQQKSDKYLATSNNENVFQLKHDIHFGIGDDQTIIDTKYKIRSKDKEFDKKAGISQGDMYQMVSYAIRRKCINNFLIYPQTYKEQIDNKPKFDKKEFIVEEEFSSNKINITAASIPIIRKDGFDELNIKKALREILKPLISSQNIFLTFIF